MHAASREAIERLEQTLDQGLNETSDKVGTGVTTGTELFDVVELLDSDRGLRVALIDPARDANTRVELAKSLFGGRVSASTEEIVSAAVSSRGPTPATCATDW